MFAFSEIEIDSHQRLYDFCGGFLEGFPETYYLHKLRSLELTDCKSSKGVNEVKKNCIEKIPWNDNQANQ